MWDHKRPDPNQLVGTVKHSPRPKSAPETRDKHTPYNHCVGGDVTGGPSGLRWKPVGRLDKSPPPTSQNGKGNIAFDLSHILATEFLPAQATGPEERAQSRPLYQASGPKAREEGCSPTLPSLPSRLCPRRPYPPIHALLPRENGEMLPLPETGRIPVATEHTEFFRMPSSPPNRRENGRLKLERGSKQSGVPREGDVVRGNGGKRFTVTSLTDEVFGCNRGIGVSIMLLMVMREARVQKTRGETQKKTVTGFARPFTINPRCI